MSEPTLSNAKRTVAPVRRDRTAGSALHSTYRLEDRVDVLLRASVRCELRSILISIAAAKRLIAVNEKMAQIPGHAASAGQRLEEAKTELSWLENARSVLEEAVRDERDR